MNLPPPPIAALPPSIASPTTRPVSGVMVMSNVAAASPRSIVLPPPPVPAPEATVSSNADGTAEEQVPPESPVEQESVESTPEPEVEETKGTSIVDSTHTHMSYLVG
jgi:hypothetical protein